MKLSITFCLKKRTGYSLKKSYHNRFSSLVMFFRKSLAVSVKAGLCFLSFLSLIVVISVNFGFSPGAHSLPCLKGGGPTDTVRWWRDTSHRPRPRAAAPAKPAHRRKRTGNARPVKFYSVVSCVASSEASVVSSLRSVTFSSRFSSPTTSLK